MTDNYLSSSNCALFKIYYIEVRTTGIDASFVGNLYSLASVCRIIFC